MQDAFDLVVVPLDRGARYREITGLQWTQIDLPDPSIPSVRPLYMQVWRPALFVSVNFVA